MEIEYNEQTSGLRFIKRKSSKFVSINNIDMVRDKERVLTAQLRQFNSYSYNSEAILLSRTKEFEGHLQQLISLYKRYCEAINPKISSDTLKEDTAQAVFQHLAVNNIQHPQSGQLNAQDIAVYLK